MSHPGQGWCLWLSVQDYLRWSQLESPQALIDLNPQEIIYISCDPSTLARDLKHFIEAGYNLQSGHAFDMFPQTAYVETMVVLKRT